MNICFFPPNWDVAAAARSGQVELCIFPQRPLEPDDVLQLVLSEAIQRKKAPNMGDGARFQLW